MLTRQGVVAETCCVETMPFRLVTTEDGRTLLAMTEHKDGMLEIVAAPVTLIAQNGTAQTSLDVKNLDGNFIVQPPFFQISVEDNGSAFQQAALLPTQTLETVPIVLERLESCIDTLQEATVVDAVLPFSNVDDASPDAKNKKICERKSVPAVTKRTTCGRSPGRPNKNASASTNTVEKLRCDICQQEFTKQMLYRKHMESHAEEKPHRCPKCPASFNIPTNFTLHMATHNIGDPKCPECGRKFARMASLKSHMLLHEKEENLFCTECEDAFSTKAQLDAHLKLHGEKWSTEETRKCKLCNKQFVQPALYRLHIREHYRLQTKVVKQTKRGAKHKTMYKCTICLKSFQKPSQLMRHIRVHTGEKPFKCTVCGRAFTQKSSLQIHTWQHNGIRPHTCDLCNAKFSQKGNLNAHILRVHNAPEGEPIYGCTYCSCIFKKLGSLNGHIKRMHTDEGNTVDRDYQEPGTTEADMRATVDSVISQLASLESTTTANVNANTNNIHPSRSQPNVASTIATKKDILQQALKNSGLPNTLETKKLDARTNFVTLLDRAADGDTRKYLTIRQRCVGNVKWYACSFCHKEFKKPSDLIRHLRIHTQEKPFKCTFCYRSFALKSTMIAHERTHTGAKKHACGSCDKTFACHASLAAHARLHAKSDKSNNGNEGGEEITVEKTRGKHHSSWRGKPKLSPEAESLVPQVVLQEPLVISDTGSRICVSQVQSKQKQSNDGTTDVARPHKCWVCHAAFRKISHLKQHYLRHTGERPYKCVKCERRFSSNSVLKSHLHTHEDSRPYSCSVCSTQFSTQSSMKRHLITHSNKRPFMCPYCHKTFKTYVNCRKHMKIHKHELAQRQLEQQKRLDAEEQSSGEVTLIQDAKGVLPSISTSTSSTVLTDNLGLGRYETIEMSFQSPLPSDFPETFSDQFRKVTSGKDKSSLPESLPETSVTDMGGSQMLHADETGTVTLPVYSREQALTPESIRDLEETLNQQLFNVELNFGLGNNLSKQISNDNAGEQESCRQQEQRPVLNVIYENSKNIDSTGTNVFASQFDSFDMSHVSLQPSGEIDMANSTNMASILPRSAKEVQQPPIPVATISVVSGGQLRTTSTRNTISNESELEERNKDAFLAEEFPGTMQDLRTQTEVHTTSTEIVGVNVINAKVPESLLQCHMCNEQGFTATGLKEHLKTHRGTKEYQCPDCPLRFCTNGGLSRHAKTHASKLWVIDDSVEIFRIDDNLSDLSYHDSYGKQWKCSLCEKVFTSKAQLRSHGKEHDAGWCVTSSELADTQNEKVSVSPDARTTTGIESDSTVSEKVLLDTVAEKEVMDRVKDALEKKERKEYTNKCKYCPKTFRKPSDLIRHTRTHTGERPYKCDYCSKSFAVKCTLDSHTKVHTGKKTFRCHVCSSLFSTKGSLKVHMRLHTGSKPFRCPVCDLRFRTSGHRKVHLLKHVREHKGNPRRKQKHLKVAAIAEVAANFEKSEERVEMTIPTEAVTTLGAQTTYEQQQELPQNIAAYPSLEVIGIEPAALTDQITFDADGTISNNNTILSVNESNHLVANLQYLLANGLFTIQTEETLLTQPPADRLRTFKNVTVHQHDGNVEISEAIQVPSAQLPIGTCLLDTAVATPPRVEPAVRTASKTTSKGGIQSKKVCDICGKTFMKPYQVERHKRIHTGERPYKCDLCTKSFAQKSTLQMHQKHHTGDRPHPCPHCEYSFTQKGNLRTHVKRVHQLDTLDMKKLRRSRQCFAPKSLQENLTEPKILSLDDISFVELLK